MKNDRDNILLDIANHLILNASNMSNLGLFHGKMGVAIFFYLYGRYSRLSYYTDFADILLDELFSELDISLSVSFENGLSGIGWGIEYLVQNNYIDGDTYEILYEVNSIFMQKIDIRRCQDLSWETGLKGILYYVLTHLTSFVRNKTVIPFDKLFLTDLLNTINGIEPDTDKLIVSFKEYMQEHYFSSEKITFPSFLMGKADIKENYIENSLGLYDGLAGVGLKFILL